MENAEYFKEKGYAEVIQESDLDLEQFSQCADRIENNRSEIITRMKGFEGGFKPEELVDRLLSKEGK